MSKVAAVAAAFVAGFALPGHARAAAPAGTPLDVAFHSTALRTTMHAHVVLPAGYDSSTGRYPVVYFLHGLPATSLSYSQLQWVADALADTGRASILVAPQGATDDDTDAEYLDWGAGRNWETFVSSELVTYVDSHFRTIAKRSGRAIVGLSAGGYGAAAIGLHHLGEYGAIESWSGYFEPTDPTGRVKLDRGSAAANARASLHVLVGDDARQIRAANPYFAFYVGTGDERFRQENVQLDKELRAAKIAHTFDLYPGGHTTALWKRHAVKWLGLALAHLTPATS